MWIILSESNDTFLWRGETDKGKAVKKPMRQKKMKEKWKWTNTAKLLEEGITISAGRGLNWRTHNVFPHLTRHRLALMLPSGITNSNGSSKFLIYITPFVWILAGTLGQFSEMRIIFHHLQIALVRDALRKRQARCWMLALRGRTAGKWDCWGEVQRNKKQEQSSIPSGSSRPV